MFLYIEKHAEIILLILVVVFIADIFIHIFSGRGGRNHRSLMTIKEDEKLLKLLDTGDEAYVFMQKRTGVPVYVSENINRLFQLNLESVYADVKVLFRGFSKSNREKIVEKLEKWDKKEKLIIEAPWNLGENKKQCEITIISEEESSLILFRMRDITAYKQKIEQLEDEIISTKQSEEAKTVFLSNMSHEIRTPLNGMLGMIALTRMNLNDTEQAKNYLNQAEELSSFLLSVINDILDMSRIESGKTELEKVPFDIREIGTKLESMFHTTMQGKGIHFELEMLEIQEPYVIGDQLRISQVLTNFLSNSLKFTQAGGSVIVTIKQMDMVEDRVSWMFRVRDTGKGMSPSFLHRIFKPFEQEDSGITRKYGGSGLGMAIADSLVKLMGGQILVESEIGKGTTFTVFVKLPKAEKSQIVEQLEEDDGKEQRDLAGRRLLMAEDQAVNALIVVKMLAAQQISVEVAKNGVEAVEFFMNHEEGYYDAILMDIHMPEMNGWDATRKIRNSQKAQAKTIPIFALSADAFVEDKRKSLEAGMDGHITKPIDYKELKRELQRKLR